MAVIVANVQQGPVAVPFGPQQGAIPVGGTPAPAIVVLQGPQGPPGATFPGFGQITYTDRVSGPEDQFQAGVRQQIKLGSSMTVQSLLNPPFKDHGFLVNNRIVGRAFGDLYRLTVNLLVTAQQDDAFLKVDIDVGSSLGPTGSASQSLSQSAGTQERVTFPLIVQALQNMMANGAGIYLTSNVACTVISEAIIIEPASTYAG